MYIIQILTYIKLHMSSCWCPQLLSSTKWIMQDVPFCFSVITTPTMRNLSPSICHPLTCLISVHRNIEFKLLTHAPMVKNFANYSTVLMFSSFCLQSYSLHLFLKLLRSAIFPLIPFNELSTFVIQLDQFLIVYISFWYSLTS